MDIIELWKGNDHIMYNDKVVQITRYYTLYKCTNAYSIQCKTNIADHKNRNAAIAFCKSEIVDYKKHMEEPMHGVTYYV